MMQERFSFKKGNRARSVFRICNGFFLAITMICVILPLIKICVDSIDPTSYGIRLILHKIDFSAYESIARNSFMYKPFLVSVFTTITGTAIGLLLTTMAGYVIIQQDMPGHKAIVSMIFFTMLFNGGLIPTYLTVKFLGLMNNYLAVIIPVGLSAYNIILMKSFFETIPPTLFEAAEIDGCSPFSVFWKIVLPLSKPALASVGLFIAVSIWNNYMNFILYIPNPDMTNFQVKVRELILSDGVSGTAITVGQDMLKSAVIIVVIFPFLLIYPFLQRYFVKGVTVGAVKE